MRKLLWWYRVVQSNTNNNVVWYLLLRLHVSALSLGYQQVSNCVSKETIRVQCIECNEISSEAQFETCWWPSERAETCSFSKGKGLPQQAEVAQGVPGRIRPRIFLTFWHHKGGRSSSKRTGRLYTRRNPWYSLSEAKSTSGHVVLSEKPRKKSPVTPPGIDPGTVRLVAKCLNHYATPGSYIIITDIKISCKIWSYRSQWPRGLKRGSATACLLGSWVRIAPGAWMSVFCG